MLVLVLGCVLAHGVAYTSWATACSCCNGILCGEKKKTCENSVGHTCRDDVRSCTMV